MGRVCFPAPQPGFHAEANEKFLENLAVPFLMHWEDAARMLEIKLPLDAVQK